MKNLLLVFLGGGIGSVCRYMLGKLMGSLFSVKHFPIGTFAANLLGCFFIGVILGFLAKHTQVDKQWSLLLATGFCGGFTTFSSFSYENIQLLQKGEWATAFAYIAFSLVLGLLACFGGLVLMK